MKKSYSNIVEDLAERLIDLEDYLEEEKNSRIKNTVGLAIDRLAEAVEDAEAASVNEGEGEKEDEDEDEDEEDSEDE